MTAIVEIVVAIAFFTVLGIVSYVSEHKKVTEKEGKSLILSQPAYAIYQR